jgi:M6 family metalloprotease-like protein
MISANNVNIQVWRKPVHKILTSALLTFLISLLLIQSAYCVPALNSIQQLEQPDGTTFAAKLWGDETGHGWETVDGYSVIKDPATKIWHYARTDLTTNKFVADGIVGSMRPSAEFRKHQRPEQAALQRDFQRNVFQHELKTINRTAASGSKPLPVLMINFNDTATTYHAADFESLLFGSGNNSMKDYFEEVSYDALTITPGAAGVTGWYTANNSLDYYGQNDGDGYDQHPGELVIEAVAAADDTIDFSEYDTDGDCYVDAVVIIHQGSGEEAGGSSDTIWSHRWNLRSAAYYGDGTGQYITNDVATCGQIIVNDYVIQPETLSGGIQTIGVFAHEYGHVLGLPDLYDIDYSSSGIGNWGLMSGGAWGAVNRPGDSPVHLCAWSKYVLRWIDPVPVSEKLTNEAIDPASTNDDVYQFFPDNQTDSQEYYLIENRQLIGFDAGLPGTGLAIWHIDEDKASYYNRDNSQECLPASDCTDTHYRVALIQADGYADLETGYNRGDSGDLYPGSSENTAFTNSSAPDSLRYDGLSSHVSIENITESHGTITASLSLSYTVTLSVTGSGRITPGDTTSIPYGETSTFDIIPDDGYQLLNVYVDDVSVGAVPEYTFFDTQLDHQIRAVFTSPSGTDSSQGQDGSGGSGGCFIAVVQESL